MNNVTMISAVRGPVMLITLGSLIALDNMMDVSFSRTWPVLVIVFGVMKLMERLAGRPLAQPVYQSPYQGPYAPPAPVPAPVETSLRGPTEGQQ